MLVLFSLPSNKSSEACIFLFFYFFPPPLDFVQNKSNLKTQNRKKGKRISGGGTPSERLFQTRYKMFEGKNNPWMDRSIWASAEGYPRYLHKQRKKEEEDDENETKTCLLQQLRQAINSMEGVQDLTGPSS